MMILLGWWVLVNTALTVSLVSTWKVTSPLDKSNVLLASSTVILVKVHPEGTTSLTLWVPVDTNLDELWLSFKLVSIAPSKLKSWVEPSGTVCFSMMIFWPQWLVIVRVFFATWPGRFVGSAYIQTLTSVLWEVVFQSLVMVIVRPTSLCSWPTKLVKSPLKVISSIYFASAGSFTSHQKRTSTAISPPASPVFLTQPVVVYSILAQLTSNSVKISKLGFPFSQVFSTWTHNSSVNFSAITIFCLLGSFTGLYRIPFLTVNVPVLAVIWSVPTLVPE